MPSRMDVGKSDRSLGKHAILNAITGRLAGIYSNPISRKKVGNAEEFIMVDLCAGDGERNSFSDTSSPSIFTEHLQYLRRKAPEFNSKLILIERAPSTYHALKNSIQKHHPDLLKYIDIRQEDAAKSKIPFGRKTHAFIHADPNAISTFPITTDFMRSLPPRSLFMITLGCNVGGLKRLPLAKRADWNKMVSVVVSSRTARQDVVLIKVLADASQWAYLIKTPIKWVGADLKMLQKVGAENFDSGVHVASINETPELFKELLDSLLLTKREIEEAA